MRNIAQMHKAIATLFRLSSRTSADHVAVAHGDTRIRARQVQSFSSRYGCGGASKTFKDITRNPDASAASRPLYKANLSTGSESFNCLGKRLAILLSVYPVANLILTDRGYHIAPHGQGFNISIMHDPERGRIIMFADGWFEDDCSIAQVYGLVADCLSGRVKIETIRAAGRILEHAAHRLDASGVWSLYSTVSFLMLSRPWFRSKREVAFLQFPLGQPYHPH